jgi:ATP-dependent DNA ligase
MAKQPRFCNPDAHRPVPWSESAVQRVLGTQGHVYAQVKKDGIRFHAVIDAMDDVRVFTREGIEIRSLTYAKDALRGLLQQLPVGFVLDGEVTVPGEVFEVASGILRRFEAVPCPVAFFVWDTFPFAALLGTVKFDAPYSNRLGNLVMALVRADNYGDLPTNVSIVKCDVVHSMPELQAFFEQARTDGEEGLVVKDPSLPVINGKRVGQWKMKPSDTADGIIRGLVWGTPGLGNAGKIIGFTVELESGVLCDATGITRAQMDEFTSQVQDLWDPSDEHPFLGRYCEVAYMEKTASGSLRHPSFVQFRDLDYAPGVKS